MAYHTGPVFFENQDGAGALQNLAGLADPLSQIWPRDSDADFFRVDGRFRNIVGIYSHVDATVQPRARLTAPSFRERLGRAALEVPTLSSTAEPGTPPVFVDRRMDPIELTPGERLGLETLNNPGSAEDQFTVLWTADGPIQQVDPKGGHWIRAITAASALTANTWGTRTLTLDENLLAGEYDVLGLRVLSTSLIAARLAFNNQVNKPGVLGADARTDIPHASFAYPGSWGVLGRFHTDNLPSIELLVDAADNEVQPVDLYVRKAR